MTERRYVNRKNIALESTYGYLNIHLELLSQAIKENNLGEMNFQMSQVDKCRKTLLNLGYFPIKERDGIT